MLLFALLFALRQVSPYGGDPLALLYVVPIALIALEFGLLGGLAATLLAVALLALWLLTSDPDLDAIGVIARVVAFAVVGGVAGHVSDRLRAANARHERLLDSGLTLAQLDTAADPAASLAAAARRVVPAAVVRVEVNGEPPAQAGEGEAAWTHTVPIGLRGERYATVTLGTRHRLSGDDCAALEMFALQAALSAENRRLLERERERVLIRAELTDAKARLLERGDQIAALVARHEAERGHVARELHDDAAQVLAAVLLELHALERQLGDEPPERWHAVRGNVDSTLQSLRALAVSLRPPILRLGLEAALEELAEAARERGFGRVALDLNEAGQLTAELETMIYRIVEETIEAVGPAREITVSANLAPAVVVSLRDPERAIDGDRLTVLKARLELAGGTVSATPDTLRAVVPLPTLQEQIVSG